MELLLVGLLIGIDNFFVCMGLGTMSLSKKRKTVLIALFVVAEALLPLIGLSLGQYLMSTGDIIESIQWICLLAVGLWILFTAQFSDYFSNMASSKRIYVFFLLPLILGFDNLLAGAAVRSFGLSILLMGSLSAIICWVGLWVGEWLNAQTPFANLKQGVLGAYCLTGLALFSIFIELA